MKNSIIKLGLASTVLLGSAAGLVHPAEAHAATKAMTPYYKWKGYTGYSASYVLDKNFVNAVKYGNVMINGMKVDAKAVVTEADRVNSVKAEKMFEKNKTASKYVATQFDTFALKTGKGAVYFMEIPVQKNKVSMKEVTKAYGKASEVLYGSNKGQTETAYTVTAKNGTHTTFYFDNKNMLTKIQFMN